MFSGIFKNLGMDLGTANTIIYAYDKGYIVNEPSVIAYKNGSSAGYKVLSIGFEAKKMLGKTGREIKVIRPLADGVIADFVAGEAMIRSFIKRANVPSFLLNRMIVGVPTGITSVEKKAIIDSALTAGARKVYLVYEPMAAAIGVGMDVLGQHANMIVDIGGGTTDIAVINYGGIVVDNTLRLASDEMNEAIIRYMKNTYYLEIGELTAEKIKIEHGIAFRDCDEKRFTVTGIDHRTGLPRELNLSNCIFVDAFSGVISAITNAIIGTLDQLPPELAGDIVDRGIVLTGGGSLLRGLDEYLRERLNLPVNVAPNALFSVAEGTRKILESFDVYSTVLFQ